MTQKIGFIGLGLMGKPMAKNLISSFKSISFKLLQLVSNKDKLSILFLSKEENFRKLNFESWFPNFLFLFNLISLYPLSILIFLLTSPVFIPSRIFLVSKSKSSSNIQFCLKDLSLEFKSLNLLAISWKEVPDSIKEITVLSFFFEVWKSLL